VRANQVPPPSSGPGALKNLSLEQLSQIEVTSPSKEPTPALRSPVAIYVLTGDDIHRSGATTIPDALRLVPGVEVAQIDSSKWSIGIRGFGTRLSRDVLVLIDGRTVYTELHAGTYWEVQDTLLDDVDRIEVIRGPGGTIWGPNAVDGVINIITKSAHDTQGALVTAGGGNQEQGFLNSRYGGSTSGGLSYRFYEKQFTRGPEYHPNGDNFDDWRGIQGGFRADWGRGRDAFTVEGDIYTQKDGEQVSLSTYSPPMNVLSQDGFEDASGGNLLFKWNRTQSDGTGTQLQVYYDRTDRTEPNLGEDRDTFDVDFLQRKKWGSRQQFIYGAGARITQGRFDEVITGLVFYPFHQTDYLLSGFFEDDITLVNKKLLLTAGSKILHTNYSHGILFQPSIRLMWTPTEKQTVWTSFTHALRTPSDAEEDFYLSSEIGVAPDGTPIFARFDPNHRFSPEQLNAYEMGFRQIAAKNVYIDVAGFYNHYHDVFSEDVTGGYSLQNSLPFPGAAPPTYLLLPAQFQNDLHGATYGGEIAPEWRPTAYWRLRGSYSLLRTSLQSSPSPTSLALGAGQDEGSSPEHEISLDSGFNIGRKFEIDLIYRYVSRLPYAGQNIPSYSTGDIRVAYHAGRHLELALAGQNLFQPYHFEYDGDPGGLVGIRRSAYASLVWVTK
jgi:iron complex outermembrane receptor protein